MMTFYAAVGSYKIRMENGYHVPYIQKLGKMHRISVPEFGIWSMLLWEVMTYDEMKEAYERQMRDYATTIPDFDSMLDLLLKRKLVMSGVGYTGIDALYNMLSNAFVVPLRFPSTKKLLTALKLLGRGKIHLLDIGTILKCEKLTDNEMRVIGLVEQTPLSTAELIRCFARDIYDVSSAEKVIAGIYPAEEDSQDAIANEETISKHMKDVLEAVSSLYLSRRIIFEIA